MTVSESLQLALADLQRDIDTARRVREAVLSAWEEHDYVWLVSAGFLAQAQVDAI